MTTAAPPRTAIKVSILVPVYNERRHIAECLRRVAAAPLPPGVEGEIIVVDDGSDDGTSDLLQAAAAAAPSLTVIRHERNLGKGAALRTALASAGGEFVLIQDGDLEYDPAGYPALLEPLLSGRADAVFGKRFTTPDGWHARGNRALTAVSNAFTGLSLTDMWTGHKAFRASCLKDLPLRCDGFSVEAELVSKLAKRRCRIQEVPISYRRRSYAEGKKIRPRDAWRSLAVMIRFWLHDDLYPDAHWLRDALHRLDQAERFNAWLADSVRGALGERVLEVGAGLGNMTQRLSPRRGEYLATDADPSLCARLEARFVGRPEVRTRRLDITVPGDFASLEGSADTVLCLNVLEHIDDDRAALRNMRAALRPGGRLVLLVPNLPFAYGSIDAIAGHRRRYRRAGLAALLRETGYELESLADFNRAALPAWIWNGRVLKRRTFGFLQLKLFDSLVWLLRRIDRFLPWPGQSLVAVARTGAA